jgi:hypothetical protein
MTSVGVFLKEKHYLIPSEMSSSTQGEGVSFRDRTQHQRTQRVELMMESLILAQGKRWRRA